MNPRPTSAPQPRATDMTLPRIDAAFNTPMPARLEWLLPGQLPRMTEPWLGQYAQHLADQHGGVLLLEAVDDRLAFSVYWPGPIDITSRWTEPFAFGEDTARLLDRLGRTWLPQVRTWLIAVPDVQDPRWHDLLELVPRWTLLMAEGTRAVIHTYHMIRSLRRHALDPSRHRVGAFIMGSEEDDAATTLVKLNAATRGLLGVNVHALGSRKRIEPTCMQMLGHLDLGDETLQGLATYLRHRARVRIGPTIS